PHPVAEVERPVELPGALADGVLADVDLDPLPAVGEIEEAGFALDAQGQDPARRAHGRRLLLELLAGARAEPRVDLRGRGVGSEIERIDLPDELRDRLELVKPVLDELGLRGGVVRLRRPGLLRPLFHRAEYTGLALASGPRYSVADRSIASRM